MTDRIELLERAVRALLRAVEHNRYPIMAAISQNQCDRFTEAMYLAEESLLPQPQDSTGKRWNCHDHRDELRVSAVATVYHEQHGQLCYGLRHYGRWLFFPVQFKDAAAAHRWVEEGCIAEIQESFSNLQVGFVVDCIKPVH